MEQKELETLYFRDISRYKVLSDEEELILVKEVQRGDNGAVNRLIRANLRFVVSVARRYRGRGLSYLELINEGNIGLLKAAIRYKSELEVKFISYAVWWIRQSIQKSLLEQSSTVRIPANKVSLMNRFKQALDHNDGDYYKTIMSDEFYDNEADIVDVIEKSRGTSLDAPLGGGGDDDGTRTLMDSIGEEPNQETEAERLEIQKVLDGVLQNITSREERILRMYYGLNHSRQFTLEEIGKELKLTRERVRLIRDRSLRKLCQNQSSRGKLYQFISRPNE